MSLPLKRAIRSMNIPPSGTWCADGGPQRRMNKCRRSHNGRLMSISATVRVSVSTSVDGAAVDDLCRYQPPFVSTNQASLR